LKTAQVVPFLVLAAAGTVLSVGWRARRLPEAEQPAGADPCALALAPIEGDGRWAAEIAALQDRARRATDPRPLLERLGWLFVARARQAADEGFYTLAEACARCVESRGEPGPGQDRWEGPRQDRWEGPVQDRWEGSDALLLRGHVLHARHRFAEAEALARKLVDLRGSPFDHGLLGDALMDLGRTGDAVAAYQRMVDLKPGLQSYARAAHARWITGDVEGARDLARAAARAGSGRDPESVAWVHARLALYELQLGDQPAALQSCEAGFRFEPGHAGLLLARGRVLLAASQPQAAVASLREAAERSGLPESLWALADALRVAGAGEEARAVEAELARTGARSDPRTLALYLATRGQDLERAVRLAREELGRRGDIFTHDALAWALHAAGASAEAWEHMERALAEGTADARLHLHAGKIAGALGQVDGAARHLDRARALGRMLLPSERELLEQGTQGQGAFARKS
jgi:tetratricopeptide (TPR) repeat protein